ncbi:MAG: hypothetical protein ACI9UJ_000606 [bacterium]|jgi:hypothetical protein
MNHKSYFIRRIAILSAFMVLPNISFAQTVSEETTESRNLKFGFNIAPNISNIRTGANLPDGVTTFNTVNYRLGFRADYSLNKIVSISPEINWSFNEGGFSFSDSSKVDYMVMPMSIDFMTHLIFKKQRNKLSPYFMLGPNIRLPIFKKSNSLPYTTKTDVAVNFGIGLEMQFEYFSFSPELRYGLGLLNISTHPLIPSTKMHNVSLALNFTL